MARIDDLLRVRRSERGVSEGVVVAFSRGHGYEKGTWSVASILSLQGMRHQTGTNYGTPCQRPRQTDARGLASAIRGLNQLPHCL
jgi:hypothetical protein